MKRDKHRSSTKGKKNEERQAQKLNQRKGK
jgi:hypothetical protein